MIGSGSHLCQLYRSREDLIDTLVPFFADGLAANERCIWVTEQPLRAGDARAALASVVPDLAERERAGQIQIIDDRSRPARLDPPDQLLAAWIEREEDALRAGYAGLRVSGNTCELAHAWSDLLEREAGAHHAFAGRKITLLCSYALDQCDADRLLDLLRHHDAALVRRERGWEIVRGATAALAVVEPRAEARARHSVEFFGDDFASDRIARTLADALVRGEAAAALATGAHLDQIRTALAAAAIDPAARIEAGQLVLIDADEVFARVWTRPGLDEHAMVERVLAPVARAVERFGGGTAYGELVDLFAREGDRDGAVTLERWWNRQLARLPLALHCGYSLRSFADMNAAEAFRSVCDEHAHVVVRGGATIEPSRLRAEHAQLAAALQAESERRRELTIARDHLIVQNRTAASFAEADDVGAIARMIVEDARTSLGASAALFLPDADTSTPPAQLGAPPEAATLAILARATEPQWLASTAAIDGARLAWPNAAAIAVIPVVMRGTRLGVLALAFAHERTFDVRLRALADDLARHAGLALERAHLMAELRRARARADAANRGKDEFLAMLGHELRNPLSPIVTATHLMRMRGDAHIHERTIIERQVKNLTRLIDDLLDVSRLASGKLSLEKRHVAVGEVIAHAVEQASAIVDELAHRLELRAPAAELVIDGDPARLAQVLTNLLVNAAKYTPRGGTIVLAVAAGADAVSISVSDDGIGIAPELLPMIFERFVQEPQGRDRARGGLGLGLSIAHAIVTQHGGTIRADSAGRDRGSCFTVELPRVRAPQVPAQVRAPHATQAPRSRRLVIVDDNQDAALMLAAAMEMLGYEVHVAHDGQSALELVERVRPHVAFIDIGLPGMDGHQLGAAIRARLGDATPHLVAVTGYGGGADRQRSRASGFRAHLVKPVDLAQLTATINQLSS